MASAAGDAGVYRRVAWRRRVLALFDLDNTLIDRQAALENWARGFARSRGLPQDAVSTICGQLRARAYQEAFARLGRVLRLGEAPADLWQEYADGIAQSSRCFPGVRGGLEALRAEGWTLGVATNGAAGIQRAKLRATGLASLFHGVGISEETESRKPAGGHFEAAAELCGSRLSAGGWMVGDGPEPDLRHHRRTILRHPQHGALPQGPRRGPPAGRP
ncbi:HAD family hydrolase [Streptomyces sp. CS014]|uniref:HAD family hydrolase n=1 Tax=Streptomyces sp. CS014 TaxID=2162707 RepID=UPI001EF3E9E5|nr:HAD family hydrolase [Streptomyces sp. CS014]